MRAPRGWLVLAMLLTGAGGTAPEREQKELRLVELVRGQVAGAPSEADDAELAALTAVLAGVSPEDTSSTAEARERATLKEILGRRDPALAAVAICRMNQTDARVRLRSIYVNELEWKDAHDRFTTEAKRANPDGALPFYELEILQATEDRLRVRAKGSGEMAGDEWELDQDGNARNTENKCGEYRAGAKP